MLMFSTEIVDRRNNYAISEASNVWNDQNFRSTFSGALGKFMWFGFLLHSYNSRYF